MSRLKILIEDIDRAISTKNLKSYVALNQRFHFMIYEQAGSPHLLQMIQDLWSQVGPFFNRLFDDETYRPKANEEHRNVVFALEAADQKAVARCLVKDIEVAAEALRPYLSNQE